MKWRESDRALLNLENSGLSVLLKGKIVIFFFFRGETDQVTAVVHTWSQTYNLCVIQNH